MYIMWQNFCHLHFKSVNHFYFYIYNLDWLFIHVSKKGGAFDHLKNVQQKPNVNHLTFYFLKLF